MSEQLILSVSISRIACEIKTINNFEENDFQGSAIDMNNRLLSRLH